MPATNQTEKHVCPKNVRPLEHCSSSGDNSMHLIALHGLMRFCIPAYCIRLSTVQAIQVDQALQISASLGLCILDPVYQENTTELLYFMRPVSMVAHMYTLYIRTVSRIGAARIAV